MQRSTDWRSASSTLGKWFFLFPFFPLNAALLIIDNSERIITRVTRAQVAAASSLGRHTVASSATNMCLCSNMMARCQGGGGGISTCNSLSQQPSLCSRVPQQRAQQQLQVQQQVPVSRARQHVRMYAFAGGMEDLGERNMSTAHSKGLRCPCGRWSTQHTADPCIPSPATVATARKGHAFPIYCCKSTNSFQ